MKYLVMGLMLLSSFAIAEEKKEKAEESQERIKLETIIVKPADRQPASTTGGRNLR